MKKRVIIIFLIAGILLVTGSVLVFRFIGEKRKEMTDHQINQLQLGMREKEVLELLGEPDRKWGLEPTRSAIDVHYHYILENGDVLELNFYPDLYDQDRNNQVLSSIVIRLSDGNRMTLLDSSDPVGTVLSVNLEKRLYSRIESEFFVASENSRITTGQINQIERGMSMASIVGFLGEPDEIVDSDTYMYKLENSMQLNLRFKNNLLEDANLYNERNEYLNALLTFDDPKGTRINYTNETGEFSKVYPPVIFSGTNAAILAEKIILIESGMTKEEVNKLLDPLEVEAREYVTEIFLDNEHSLSMSLVFDSTLCEIYIMQTSPESRTNFVIYEIITDRDPIGTRIQYDPETGYFSKILPE